MTLLSSRRQNTANNYYNTSTHKTHTYSSPWRNWTKRVLYHSWIPWSLQVPTIPILLRFYRKPTHRHQYPHWERNHFTGAKHSVFNTLAQRAKVVSASQQSHHQELVHIRNALQPCSFPTWASHNL